jgi:hypothetical protein
LNYKRGSRYRERGKTPKNTWSHHITTHSRALRALHHPKRIGIVSLSQPKLVRLYPLLQAPWAYRTLPRTGHRAPRGARTSITLVSLVPTIRIRRTNIPKFTCQRYQTPTVCKIVVSSHVSHFIFNAQHKSCSPRYLPLIRYPWNTLFFRQMLQWYIRVIADLFVIIRVTNGQF